MKKLFVIVVIAGGLLWAKKHFSNKPDAYCTKCKRYETRPDWVQKAQCSLCHGPLVPGPHTAY